MSQADKVYIAFTSPTFQSLDVCSVDNMVLGVDRNVVKSHFALRSMLLVVFKNWF